ncbi:MAG: DsbA family oxidoreductase [Cytophagaceae bacterium]|jgi:predicted DsbA family dithiol-disulfide isomerase|nr:DsbA family oxidoreductase [Cytophagaceae bacterium]
MKEFKEVLSIDVVSDVACPWCYIGKKRLEKALEEEGLKAEINFHPFQLDPTLPETGVNREMYFENKFGSPDRVEAVFSRVEAVGATEGIHFNFRSIPTIPNTLSLHVLMQKAKEEGRQLELAAYLFEAYMVQPIDLSKEENVINIMLDFGWTKEKTMSVLHDDSLRYQVKQEIHSMQQKGISGVPFFIINQQYALSGAQPVEVWKEVFQQLRTSSSEADSCDVDGNNC